MSQYGFRQGHSTEHLILDIVSRIQSNGDAGAFSCGVFIDLKNAFDTYSLRHRKCGVRGFIHELFVSKPERARYERVRAFDTNNE